MLSFAPPLRSALQTAGNSADVVRLSGEVPGALATATKLKESIAADAELTLTLVLNRADQAGFEKFLGAVQSPSSPLFRQYLTSRELASRFGPTEVAYTSVKAWLERKGFKVLEGSENRLTFTVRGTRATAEEAFGVRLNNYRIENRTFYANDTEPALPAEIAPDVQAVIGLSNLAEPVRARATEIPERAEQLEHGDLAYTCWLCGLVDSGEKASLFLDVAAEAARGGSQVPLSALSPAVTLLRFMCVADELGMLNSLAANAGSLNAENTLPSTRDANGINHDVRSAFTNSPSTAGAGQKIGLVEFDNFNPSDVQNFLQLVSRPNQFAQLSQVHVNGGAGAPGAEQAEVLLDIDVVMSLAPGAQVIVYDGPFHGRGSYQAMFNAMINDGVNVISNSWAYCEDQTTATDVQSIDSILANAAAAGITVVTGSGDKGSTCLNGSPNVAHVPATSTYITAVGGTTPSRNVGGTYGSEKWWSNPNEVEPTGQGGFGVSLFFHRPSYQTGLTDSPMRSIPDVTAPADPAAGYFICQESAGGCPTNLLYGGTSAAAPIWAAFVAVLNQQENRSLGFLNPLLYPLAKTNAFYSATDLASDFAHVGLGSPNVGALHLALGGGSVGAVAVDKSVVGAFPPVVVADGKTGAGVIVALVDANGNSVSGQNVQLTMNNGAHAALTTLNSTTNTSNGAALFTVTDTALETVTFTATVNGATLSQQPTVRFVSPPASSGGISASPNTVNANLSDTATITVTLQDANGNPSPDKVVSLSQGDGGSLISGTTATTDATGKVQFTATSGRAEMITYTATDITDGNLPIPGSATVQFVNPSGPCSSAGRYGLGTAAPGYAVSTFASNFPQTDCNNGVGPVGVAFDTGGNLLVSDWDNDLLYKFGPEGGSAGPATTVGKVNSNGVPLGVPLAGLAFTKDGRLYLALEGPNNVVELDPGTAAVLRTVVNLHSPLALAVDPVSGDLFVSTSFGYGVQRISNFADGPGTLTNYFYSSSEFTDGIVFGPDGTLYVMAYSQVIRVAGTNTPNPGEGTVLTHISNGDGIGIEPNPANPSKPFLYVNDNNGNITRVDTSALPANSDDPCDAACTQIYTGGTRGDFVTVGPDGCLYATQSERVIKVTKADGTCGLAPGNPAPQIVLTPQNVIPPPAQGTQVTLTATLKNVTDPANVPITLLFAGANPGPHLVTTDAQGVATFTKTGVRTGTDQVVAFANVKGALLRSNLSVIGWTAGQHKTSLSLNLSPAGGAPDRPLKVTATLVDLSTSPVTPVSGANVKLALAGGACNGTTDSNGTVSCSLQPTLGEGSYTLTATFDGTTQLLPSSNTKGIDLFVSAQSQLLNISTRMAVQSGDNVLIGGFIITGTDPKNIFIRGIGPSLGSGVAGALADPTLELHQGSATLATNDNWKINDQTGQSQEADIRATTIPPTNDLESAILMTLSPGTYTAILAGKNGGTGVGLVEVYDLAQAANSKLANISSRGFVDTNDNVMIGGLIVGNNTGGTSKVIVRAIGPSLSSSVIQGALQDPTLELHDGNGATLRSNDNWKTREDGSSQQAEIEATTIPPTNDLESAIVATVAPGNYTAIVRGKNNTTGIAVVEAYNLQ